MKHIHHHKKIYITNHPAPSQYAPAYLSGVKGAVAVPTNTRPAVASFVPYNSVDLYDESRTRLKEISPAASKLLPLYRARGHYGPKPSEWEEQEYDLASSVEPTDIYEPTSYSAPSAPEVVPASRPPKRVKFVKVNELPRKKVVRKIKPKRVFVRGRPQPPPPPPPPLVEEEHPVSSFHEQFYSDLEETGTIKKIRKPPRIEKIFDGDTEHIHTYSEEHIHKVVFDDDPKVTGVVGVNPIGSMSALTAAHPLIPIKNAQTLVAIPSNSFSDLTVVGSMGTPSHLEYASYNPREVTHDHIFHDHGVIPSGVQVTKDAMRLPPKVSYNSHGVRISGSPKWYPIKQKKLYSKPTKPTHDFLYYESIYTPSQRQKKLVPPTIPTPHYEVSPEAVVEDYRPIPAFRFNDKRKTKTRSTASLYPVPNFQLQQPSVPAPFSVSSTVVHDYGHKNYAAPTGFSKYGDPLINFKDSYSGQDFDYDAFGSSSNVYTSEDKNDSTLSLQGKQGKKSVSTQNISFGGQDSQTFVDHLGTSTNSQMSISDNAPSAEQNFNNYDDTTDSASPTPYTIKETSPAHPYYTAMALRALHGDQPEASNDNVQYAQAPTQATETTELPLATTTSHTIYYKIQSTDAITPETEYIPDTRPSKKRRERNKVQSYDAVFKELLSDYRGSPRQNVKPTDNQYADATDSTIRGNPKYGDKI